MKQIFARYVKVYVFFAVSVELFRNITQKIFAPSWSDGGAFDKTLQIVYF